MRGEVRLSAHSIHPQPPPKWRPPQLCVLPPPRDAANRRPQRLLRAPRVPAAVLAASLAVSSADLAADDGAAPSSSVRPGRSPSGEKVRPALAPYSSLAESCRSFRSTLRPNITPPSPSWRPTTPLCPTSRRAENQCPVFSATRGTMCRAVSPNGSRLSEVSSVRRYS